jgi:hypothetical protein
MDRTEPVWVVDECAPLFDRHSLIGGMHGSGKTAGISAVLAGLAADTRITVTDSKSPDKEVNNSEHNSG